MRHASLHMNDVVIGRLLLHWLSYLLGWNHRRSVRLLLLLLLLSLRMEDKGRGLLLKLILLVLINLTRWSIKISVGATCLSSVCAREGRHSVLRVHETTGGTLSLHAHERSGHWLRPIKESISVNGLRSLILTLGMHELGVRSRQTEVRGLPLSHHRLWRLLMVCILITISSLRWLLAIVSLLVELLLVVIFVILFFELKRYFSRRALLSLLISVIYLLSISVWCHHTSLPSQSSTWRIALLIFRREIVSRRTLSLWGRRSLRFSLWRRLPWWLPQSNFHLYFLYCLGAVIQIEIDLLQ